MIKKNYHSTNHERQQDLKLIRTKCANKYTTYISIIFHLIYHVQQVMTTNKYKHDFKIDFFLNRENKQTCSTLSPTKVFYKWNDAIQDRAIPECLNVVHCIIINMYSQSSVPVLNYFTSNEPFD